MEVAQPTRTADRVNALLLHVRSNPGEHDPDELAREFQVPESLVREIVAQRKKAPRAVRLEPKSSPVARWFARAIESLDSWFDRLISHPYLFVVLTTALALGLVTVVKRLGRDAAERVSQVSGQSGGLSFGFTWSASASFFVILTFFAIQMVAFFRLRRSRFPLLAGSLVFLTFALLAINDDVRTSLPAGMQLSAVELKIFILIGCLLLGLFYSAIGTLVSVAGGWLHMTSEERRFRSMSRLEMLERYFEVEEALEKAPELSGVEKRKGFWIVEAVRAQPFAWICGLALAGGLLTIALYAGYNVNPSAENFTAPVSFIGLSMLLSFSTMLAFGFIVWQAPSIPKAVLLALVYNFVGSIIYFVPVHFPGREGLLEKLTPGILALSLATYGLMGAVIGLASKIGRHAARQAGIKSGDPSALIRELVRLEQRLMVDTGRVCVMSVDVAGSTKMKAGADPMDAEYSFAAYQAWVADVCRRKGGRVHSTAGDGAIVSFGDARSAFEAGCVLQVGVAWLNRERNRLPSPFSLRVGLHEGEVAADLDKLQFTRVIDVAAHVESVSPVGGLAATEEVAGQLSDVPWILLDEAMDGHRVFTIGSDLVPRFGMEQAAMA